jgi:hypothetical protein
MEVSGQLHAPVTFSPGKVPPVHYRIENWVGHRINVDVVMKKKNSFTTLTGKRIPVV